MRIFWPAAAPKRSCTCTCPRRKIRLEAEGIPYRIETDQTLAEEDWANAWKRFYHPTHLGKRLVVCPSWEEYTPTPEELVMTLDPGMAFGSGTHHTTRLCCELLAFFPLPH